MNHEMKTTCNPQNIVQKLIRCARKGAMASLHSESKQPYASLVTLASTPSGTPLFLISKLAIHTKNIQNNPHISILIDDSDHTGNPVEGARVTLQGQATTAVEQWARHRFLTFHPDAEQYSDFKDFDFYYLKVKQAHFVGGFGKIQTLPANEFLVDVSSASSLIEAETEILSHMNEDHAEVVELIATRLLKAEPDRWRMIECDPAGFNIGNGVSVLRMEFSRQINSPDEARRQFIELAARARQN